MWRVLPVVRVRVPALPAARVRDRRAAVVRGPVLPAGRGRQAAAAQVPPAVRRVETPPAPRVAASTALLRLEAWRSAAAHLFKRATPCLKHGLSTDRNGSTFRIAALAGFHGTFDLLDTPTELTGRDFAPALLLGWGHDDLVSLALPPFNCRRARLRFGCGRASLLCSFRLGIQPRTFGVLHLENGRKNL
jgi:hypothetical protein